MRNVWTRTTPFIRGMFTLSYIYRTFIRLLFRRKGDKLLIFAFCKQMFWIKFFHLQRAVSSPPEVYFARKVGTRAEYPVPLLSVVHAFNWTKHYLCHHLSPLTCDLKTFYLRRSKVKPFSNVRNWITIEWNVSVILQKMC